MTDRPPVLFGGWEGSEPGAEQEPTDGLDGATETPDRGSQDVHGGGERSPGETGLVWPPLLGGEAGLRQLEAALAAPVHAFLLVGTVAGDKRAVARAFAGELLGAAALSTSGQAESAERHRERARRAVHPDVVLVEPEGRALLAAEATAIITEAARRPLEGAGKVIICDRFHTASPAVAASLLKTVEEPPPDTTIVLLADDVPPGHITVASRCVTIRFPAPSPEEMREWVVGSGVPPEVAGRAARALGCDPGRAGDLVAAGSLAERLEAWWSIPERLDGTGARAASLVDGLRALIDAAVDAAAGAAADPAGPTAPEPAREDSGDPGADPTGAGGRAERQRSDRRRRRVRDAELRFGFAVLAERYHQLLDTAAGSRPGSSTFTSVPPEGAVGDALALLRESTAALVRNPDEKLLLQNLLLHLPRLDDIDVR
ncbi:MAG: hypothetical protein OXI26_11835 [bacterium]|nr:hypothetical protein [bacterium]